MPNIVSHFRPSSLVSFILSLVATSVLSCLPVLAEDAACPQAPTGESTPAEAAYAAARYSLAEDLYGQALLQKPHDLPLSARLVQTWLHEGQVTQAAALVNKMQSENPNSAITLAALAEIQIRQGQPWLALQTLKQAEAADPCYGRTYLIRSHALRIDSMYASERVEIQKAYDINPIDPDIRHAWLSTVAPAHDIESMTESLATTKDLDADTRGKAENSIRSMMPLLSENNQTCQVLPTAADADFVMQSVMSEARHVDGYRLEVELPKTRAHLQVDTAASGLFISRAMADQNGLLPSDGAPPGTVHADNLRIGPLEFRDCILGVSDTPFSGKSDGFIGMDMFAGYMVNIDYPAGRLALTPLPPRKGVVPGDRTITEELRGFTPVYHRHQYLLAPAMVGGKTRSLFVLDSGMRFSTMIPEVAHAVSTTKVNFTNAMQTVSGPPIQVYRDSFDFEIAGLSLPHQSHILEWDTSAMSQNAGLEIAGMVGFDMLHSLVLHLDYRDGLIRLESPAAGTSSASGTDAMTASRKSLKVGGEAECERVSLGDLPIGSTIQARVTGLLESTHLKPGKEITVTVVNEWQSASCNLPAGSIIFGHVTAAGVTKNPDSAELGLVFDHAECDGKAKRAISLQILGFVAPPDQFVGLHNVMPAEVHGLRNIASTAASLGSAILDENLNPGGAPHTIHPGIVAGAPTWKLEPNGGPNCSTRITTPDRNLRLGVGSELILAIVVSQ